MSDKTLVQVSRDDLYTVRWYAKEIEKVSTVPAVDELARDLYTHATKLLGETQPDREDPVTIPGDVGGVPDKLEHPLLTFPSLMMKSQGTPAKGVLDGMVIHHSAGQYDKGLQSAKDMISWGKTQGFAYWTIATTGEIVKTHELNQWGYHCGKSKWPGVGTYVSDRFLGVEVCNAGKLTKQPDGTFKSWFGATIPAAQVRHIPEPRYKGETPGYYHMFSAAQEAALFDLAMYLKSQNPSVFQIANITGHDELRYFFGLPGDKQDPGGSLSMGMPEFRRICAERWTALVKA